MANVRDDGKSRGLHKVHREMDKDRRMIGGRPCDAFYVRAI